MTSPISIGRSLINSASNMFHKLSDKIGDLRGKKVSNQTDKDTVKIREWKQGVLKNKKQTPGNKPLDKFRVQATETRIDRADLRKIDETNRKLIADEPEGKPEGKIAYRLDESNQKRAEDLDFRTEKMNDAAKNKIQEQNFGFIDKEPEGKA